MAYQKRSGKSSAFYTLLSVLFGVLFGVLCAALKQTNLFTGNFIDRQAELLGYQIIISSLLVIFTPNRFGAALNSGLFFFISDSFSYVYSFIVTGKFDIWVIIFCAVFAVAVFFLSLIVWQFKKGGWLSSFGASIPLSLLSCECIYLILRMISGFTLISLINIIINIGFSVYFYIKIPSASYTKIKTSLLHILLTVLITLYWLWLKGIIIFVI